MADLAQDPGALLFGALLLIAVALLIAVLVRLVRLARESADLQARQEETVTDYIERLMQEVEARREADAARDLGFVQSLLHDSAQATAARVDALGTRLDQSGTAQEDRLRSISRVLDERLAANDQKVERMRETLYEGVTKMQRENAEKLDEMRKTVDENLHTTLNRRLGESFQQVSDRLEQVYKGLGEMQSLAAGVGDLKRVLTNVKTRGTWGEVQLGNLLRDMLTRGQYEQNVAIRPGSQERVEYAILLPGREEEQPVYLAIDAKFPMEAYERLQAAQEAGEKAEVDLAVQALANAIKVEGGRIAAKYIVQPYTVDFALMYLPNEGLYAQVLQVPGLAETLQRQHRVVVAGPTTLTALLNSLQMGFRTLAIEKRSGEVWRLLSIVKQEFGRFGDILDKTQQRLRQASESIEDATRKTRTIERRLRNVEDLETDLPTPQMLLMELNSDLGPDEPDTEL
ncbi:MAG: DNA recombination protein RmuC [Clostridiales bacterium]|nr:DNA recombination protein RmuC [Clostridiales bacterium]